jgi:hypothetical protein
MSTVTLVLEGQDASLARSILNVVNAQKQMEGGIKSIGTASATMERQVVGSFNKIDSVVRQGMREFENRRRAMERREGKFIEPARLAGTVNLADESAIREYRGALAQNRRFDRVNIARAAQDATLRASQEAFAKQYWADKDASNERLQAQKLVDEEIALNNFDNKINKMKAARQKRRELISNTIQGAAAATAMLYTAGMFFDQASEKLTLVGDAGIQFNEEMRPLLALGGNLKDIAGQKLRVRDVSTGLGIDTASAAHGLFMLQSAAANLGPAGQQDILGGGALLTRVAGGDFQTNLTAVTKLMQTYGKEMGNAATAANKLLMTQDQAAVTMEELSQLMPDVLPAARLMKVTYDELAGSIITATQVLGRNEKTFTGIRNLFLHLPEARAAGLVKPGSNLLQILDQLHNVDPDTMIKVFGERTVSVVAALAEKSGEVAKNFKMMHDLGGNAGMEKFALRMQDAVTFDAEILKSAKEQIKNAEGAKFEDAWLRRRAVDLKLTEAGYEMRDDPLAELLDFTGLGKKLNMAASMTGGELSEDRGIALNQQVAALRRSKDPASRLQADRILVRDSVAAEIRDLAGETTLGKIHIGSWDVGKQYLVYKYNSEHGDEIKKAGEGRLEVFDRLYNRGFGLSAEQFAAYEKLLPASGTNRQDRLRGEVASKMYLSRFAGTDTARQEISNYLRQNLGAINQYGTKDQVKFAYGYDKELSRYNFARLFNNGLSFDNFTTFEQMLQTAPEQAQKFAFPKASFRPIDLNKLSGKQKKDSLLSGGAALLNFGAGAIDGAKSVTPGTWATAGLQLLSPGGAGAALATLAAGDRQQAAPEQIKQKSAAEVFSDAVGAFVDAVGVFQGKAAPGRPSGGSAVSDPNAGVNQ